MKLSLIKGSARISKDFCNIECIVGDGGYNAEGYTNRSRRSIWTSKSQAKAYLLVVI